MTAAILSGCGVGAGLALPGKPSWARPWRDSAARWG